MSLRDDFLEALNGVKRDFLKDSDYASPSTQPLTASEQENSSVNARPETAAAEFSAPADAFTPNTPDEVVYEAFKQASALTDNDDTGIHTDSISPYRDFDPAMPVGGLGESGDFGGSRKALDFGENSMFSDDKTVISKNTVIRGALQTEDSLRLLGQILGDIECKSNVVLAGKVRGNTTAANAYIFDAQVDGDIRCDDIVTISSDAWVLGNIRAQQAEIDGKIKGNIEIRNAVSIGSTSSVLGNISAEELEIKRGAFVNGQIMMYSPSRDVIDRFDRFEE